QQGVALDLDRLAVAVEATRDHLHISLDLPYIAGDRQAPLQADLLTLVLDHLRIHQHVQVGVGLDHADAQADPDVGRGPPDARGGNHGVDHVVDPLTNAAV